MHEQLDILRLVLSRYVRLMDGCSIDAGDNFIFGHFNCKTTAVSATALPLNTSQADYGKLSFSYTVAKT